MQVAILGVDRGWHTQQLTQAFEANGHRVTSLSVTRMVGQINIISDTSSLMVKAQTLDEFDLVLVRLLPRGSLEQIIFRMDALHLLMARGTRVVNSPRAIEQTVDKYFTSGLLAQAGLPTPRTVVCENSEAALAAFTWLGGDVIVKPLFGSMGLGMVRIQDEAIAYRVFKALSLERAVYYLQETIPHPGRDLRAFVVGGRIIAAMARVTRSQWRTNVAQGAAIQSVQLTSAQADLCLQATELLQLDYAGVDLLPINDKQTYLLEINGIPGWKGLQTVCDFDIATAIVTHLEESLTFQ